MAFPRRDSDGFDSDSSIVQVLLSPFTAIRDWFADAVGGDDAIRTEASPFAKFIGFVSLPFRLLFAFAIFMVQAWSTSRVGRAFLLGLPAVGTVTACGAAAWISTFYFNSFTLGRTNGYYSMHAQNPESDPENKLMFARKLVELKPKNPEYKYRLGLALDATDRTAQAISLMNMMAPLDSQKNAFQSTASADTLDNQPDANQQSSASNDEPTGDDEDKARKAAGLGSIEDYVPAHLWLSSYYQRKLQTDGYNREYDELAIDHLEHAAISSPENRTVQISLARLYEIRAKEAKEAGPENQEAYIAAMKNIEAALIEAIKPPITTLPQVAQIPRLIEVKRELAELDQSRDFDQTRQYFDSQFKELLKVSSKSSDQVRMYVFEQVINGYVNLKEFDKAVGMVSQALQTFDATAAKRKLVGTAGQIFLKSAEDNKDLDDRAQYQRRLNAICACLNSNVREKQAYDLLVGLIRHNQMQPEKIRWIQESLLSSPKLSVNHLLIGHQLIHEGADDGEKLEQGNSHWKIAYKLEPAAQLILANIVEVALADDGLPIENLELMIREAIEMFPDQGRLHQSMGILLMKRDETDNAIASFESAVALEKSLYQSHHLLARLHEKLGDTTKANYHNNLVETFFAGLPPDKQELMRRIMETW